MSADPPPNAEFGALVAELKEATLPEIAAVIAQDWHNVYFGAQPYLDAMFQRDTVNDKYGADDMKHIVAYFISNARTWSGPTARMVKAELKARIK